MIIEISKSNQMASIRGGDSGPGTGDPIIGLGNNYTWSLAIADIEPNTADQTLVMNTLNSVMGVIGSVAQSSCQSISFVGAGGYDGEKFSIGGAGEISLGQGQLQSQGSQIDLSGVQDPGFADLSKLPTGTLDAAPDAGVTKWPLVITITD